MATQLARRGLRLHPDDLPQNKIRDLPVGATGYTVPWALMVDEDGAVYIRGDYMIEVRPMGTVEMQVLRKPEGLYVTEQKRGSEFLDPRGSMDHAIRCWDAEPVVGWIRDGILVRGQFTRLKRPSPPHWTMVE
jgi:hypothetical protein